MNKGIFIIIRLAMKQGLTYDFSALLCFVTTFGLHHLTGLSEYLF